MEEKKPNSIINFTCGGCGEKFKDAPTRIEDVEDRPWHPFEYFCNCPKCGVEVSQVTWEKNIFKANTMATGPRTAEGRANSAKNLEGHPTPQEAQITRLNAMKHGLFARTAQFFPAKPGRYPQCSDCEYLKDKVCVDHKACLKRAEVMLRHQVAFENKDPSKLMGMFADTHAAMQTMIDWMIMQIAADGGPELTNPTWYYDKDGTFHLAKWTDDNGEKTQLFDKSAHPLLKPLIDYVSKLSMSLEDLGMTPKVQEESDIMKGFIEHDKNTQESESDFKNKLSQDNQKLMDLIKTNQLEQPVKVINPEEKVIEHNNNG